MRSRGSNMWILWAVACRSAGGFTLALSRCHCLTFCRKGEWYLLSGQAGFRTATLVGERERTMHNYDDAYYHSQHLDASALATIHRAEQEAQRLHCDAVEPEHLLLALVSRDGNMACELLQDLGLPAKEVKTQLDSLVEAGPDTGTAQTPMLTRATQYVIDAAVDESRRINQQVVGSEHLLLALLREGSSPAAKVLHQHGVTYERARAQLYRKLGA